MRQILPLLLCCSACATTTLSATAPDAGEQGMQVSRADSEYDGCFIAADNAAHICPATGKALPVDAAQEALVDSSMPQCTGDAGGIHCAPSLTPNHMPIHAAKPASTMVEDTGPDQ